MIDPSGVEAARPALNAVYGIALLQKQLRKVAAVSWPVIPVTRARLRSLMLSLSLVLATSRKLVKTNWWRHAVPGNSCPKSWPKSSDQPFGKDVANRGLYTALATHGGFDQISFCTAELRPPLASLQQMFGTTPVLPSA